ncbi:hypothetical protein H257_01654 [Aphanomyces astaci]|uniref:EamA domain-containing protein n=2 Tax=Aphanomyces astaci TaxID=112090 RepID=W4H3I0_APHAT|nr:hypothetical protein H257_01654 [Aphanomyces astaci]ETV86462.1 hypothetical protein H257_01654 [Aphanomyces astaci]|eukprot:XP_009823261.1 hypothetical protein H257_01654 [Aphanomyces astaci]
MTHESLPLVTKHAEDGSVNVASASDVLPPQRHRLLGLGLVAMSAFTFSLMSAAIKYESSYMSSMETLFWRAIVAWIFNLILVLATRTNLHVPSEFMPPLAFRCVVGFCSMSLTFWTMSQMVLADASCIVFTSPVMAFLLGSIVLGEHIKPVDFALAIFCFSGVVFVARPVFLFGDEAVDYMANKKVVQGSKFAVLGGLASAACQASAYVAIRHIKSLNFIVVIHYFMLACSVLSVAWIFAFEGGLTLELPLNVWWLCVSTGVFGFLGQLCMTKGFQLENVGIASVMRYLDIVFVFVWDVTLLHEQISVWSFVGAAIILSCAIAIAIRKAHG